MISYADAKALVSDLDADYSRRHDEHRRLRQFWQSRYWEDVDSEAHGIHTIFRDMAGAGQSDFGPDMKLVRNLIFDVCVKYQSFLSTLPMIQTFVDRPDSRTARKQANLKERVLYGTWANANMNQQLNRGAWYGPLMGDWFLGAWPDFDHYCVKAVVRSPEYAYPLPCYDESKLDAVLFCWKTTEQRAKRAYPSWPGKKQGDGAKETEILEYSGDMQFVRWVDGFRVSGVEHNLGFNLFDQVPFIHVPGEAWNHGAVEQAASLVEAGNALNSLIMQAAIDNVFPRLVLEDPHNFGEEIDTGPGAVIAVKAGGKAYFLSPGGQMIAEGAAILEQNEQAIKRSTSMPDVSFGQMDASVITGKAVNALQAAGTGSVVEMVQGTGVGVALENFNVKALTMYQRLFPDDTIYLHGVYPTSSMDLNPRQFAVKFKGSEIVGSPRNNVVFSPYVDMHGKLVMGLQALGAGLVSKEWAREQIGISDSEAMQEEITGEVVEEAVVGAILAQLQQEPTPDSGDQAWGQAVDYLSGEPVVRAPALPAQPPGTVPPEAGGGGLPVASLPGGGQVSAPALPLPPGAPLAPAAGPPGGGGPAAGGGAALPPAAPTGQMVSVQQALQALQQVPIQGRAWLVGQIAAEGQAPVADIAVTNPDDRQPLDDAADFPTNFVVVQGQPSEQAVEITRG